MDTFMYIVVQTYKPFISQLIVIFSSSSSSSTEAADSSDDEELGESVLETVQVEVGTLHLREHEIQPSRHRKKKRKKKEANKMDDDGMSNFIHTPDGNASRIR